MDTTILKAAPTQSPANVAMPPSPLPSVPISKPAALSLNEPKLDNLAGDIWKSAERLRSKFKAYEYQNVILSIIVIRRLECVLIDWREKKTAEFRALMTRIESQIATLTDYRNSLIHECVTG